MQVLDDFVTWFQEQMSSGDLERQDLSFRQTKAALDQAGKIAVEAFRVTQAPFVIAERLHWLGSSVVEPLRSVLKSGSEEHRVLAAIVMLQVGSFEGSEWLIKEIQHGTRYPGLAAQFATARFLPHSVEAVLGRLSIEPMNSIDVIVALTVALEKAGVELPESIRVRFLSSDAPWQVRSLVSSRVS